MREGKMILRASNITPWSSKCVQKKKNRGAK